jgi:hypothetical protein
LETVQIPTGPSSIGGDIGNSLFWKGDQLVMVSGKKGKPGTPMPLLFTAIDESFNATPLTDYSLSGEDNTFPTGTLVYNGITYIGFSGHEAGAHRIFRSTRSFPDWLRWTAIGIRSTR